MSYYTKKLEQISADPLQKAAYDTDDSTVVIHLEVEKQLFLH